MEAQDLVEKLTPLPPHGNSVPMQVIAQRCEVESPKARKRIDGVTRARIRAQAAALELQASLSDLCDLGVHVAVRVEPGFEAGAVSPSVYYVEVDVD